MKKSIEFQLNTSMLESFADPKFKNYIKDNEIHKKSNLKEQWLDSFLNCSKGVETPEDKNEIIKRVYEIANWTKEERDAYELSKINEAYTMKEKIAMKEEAEKIGFDKGELIVKWKGKVKGELKQFKILKQLEKRGMDIEEEEYLKSMKHTKIYDVKLYFEQNPEQVDIDDNESLIMGAMEIE
eukprot:GHVL01000791.1.p2 GENE.GHVL01000791.1~~GHVL01000791.1.p2  ORF type:complete len:183 (+),score=45.88 GHVL01000791.1:47-595(+)